MALNAPSVMNNINSHQSEGAVEQVYPIVVA